MQITPVRYDQDFPPLLSQIDQKQQFVSYDFSSQQPQQKPVVATSKPKVPQEQKIIHKVTEEKKVNTEEKWIKITAKKEPIKLQQVGGKDLYKALASEDKFCNAQMWKRVLREVQDVNDDFQSLRTCIGVVTDTIGALHFLLYPSDGAMADKALCGRILIPKEYPAVPPVVHLFTQTNRGNVDVYRCYIEPTYLHHMHSSMCFDILRSKASGGTWQPEYTLSALISSLLQAIVSVKVPQQYGGELIEFVNMEKLSSIHRSVEATYERYKDVMPSRKQITHIEALQVKTKYFKFPEKIASYTNRKDLIIESNSIFLQGPANKMSDNVYSIGFDLSDLKTNPATVFSIILSNFPPDPTGQDEDTILVRNGVTATAAKKKAGGFIDWFYHGKPMNESDLKLIVTVGYNQFCISYYVDGDRKVIHGDRPVSFLTPAEIGKVDNQPFYLSVFLKNKGGPSITVKTFIPECGCVHPVAGADS